MEHNPADPDSPGSQRVLLVAFEGWSDAGTAASSAVAHLASALDVSLITEIDAERYVDYQLHRPRIRLDERGERVLDWPHTKFWGPVATPGRHAAAGPDAGDAGPRGATHDGAPSAGGSDAAGATGSHTGDAGAPGEAAGATTGGADRAATAPRHAADAGFAQDPLAAEVLDVDDIAGALRTVLSLDDGPDTNEIYVLTGVEPARHWREYVDELMTLVLGWEIDLVILAGALFSDTPHSRPVPVTAYSPQERVRRRFDAERSDYEGPAGIGTVFEQALAAADIDVIALFAQIPHYVHSMPSPKATLAILDALEELFNLVIPHGTLITDAQQWEEQVSLLTQQDEDMQGYIERLEAERDTVESPEATGDALAHEFEKFLRRTRGSKTAETDAAAAADGDTAGEADGDANTDGDTDGDTFNPGAPGDRD